MKKNPTAGAMPLFLVRSMMTFVGLAIACLLASCSSYSNTSELTHTPLIEFSGSAEYPDLPSQGISEESVLPKVPKIKPPERPEPEEILVQKETQLIRDHLTEQRATVRSLTERSLELAQRFEEIVIDVPQELVLDKERFGTLFPLQEKIIENLLDVIQKNQERLDESTKIANSEKKLAELISLKDHTESSGRNLETEVTGIHVELNRYEEFIETFPARAAQARKRERNLAQAREKEAKQIIAQTEQRAKDLEKALRKSQNRVQALQSSVEAAQANTKKLEESQEQLQAVATQRAQPKEEEKSENTTQSSNFLGTMFQVIGIVASLAFVIWATFACIKSRKLKRKKTENDRKDLAEKIREQEEKRARQGDEKLKEMTASLLEKNPQPSIPQREIVTDSKKDPAPLPEKEGLEDLEDLDTRDISTSSEIPKRGVSRSMASKPPQPPLKEIKNHTSKHS